MKMSLRTGCYLTAMIVLALTGILDLIEQNMMIMMVVILTCCMPERSCCLRSERA